MGDRKLLLTAICVLSQWTLQQIVASYRISEAECMQRLAQDFAHQHWSESERDWR